QRLAGGHINFLRKGGRCAVADFNGVIALTEVHRLVVLHQSGVGAIDEDLIFLVLAVDFHRTDIVVVVIAGDSVVTRSPDRSKVTGAVETIADRTADKYANRSRSTERSQRHQGAREHQSDLFHKS